jgi:predicted alpha/beta-fold hydrolase
VGIEDRVERVLKKLKLNKFYPFPFARSAFWQTIYGYQFPILKPCKPDFFHHLILPDGDILVVTENRPKRWKTGGRIMLLIHGLTGSYESTYMQRMCRRMEKKGYMVLRLNLRFCGPGRGLARKPYHCGVSDDARFTLEWIKKQYPDSPVTQIGFSLGGNVTLKMAGEDGSRPSGNLDSIVAVSAPLDLRRAAELFHQPENRFFQNIFLKYLKSDLELMGRLYPDTPFLNVKSTTIREFDEQHTAPIHGFESAEDYYRKCSSIHFIPEIKIPTLILSSIDDPIADPSVIRKIEHGSNVDVLLTEQGGHCGFLGFGTEYNEVRWSDQAVARWLEDTMAI